jgi:hypothetical protein
VNGKKNGGEKGWFGLSAEHASAEREFDEEKFRASETFIKRSAGCATSLLSYFFQD